MSAASSFWPAYRPGAGGFAEVMIASFPATLPSPEPLQQFFRWLEGHAQIESWKGGRPFASLYPDDPTQSMGVEPVDPERVRAWTRGDEEASRRLAPFVRTGGDGSYAALWLDELGASHIVHLGSGSGSLMLCTLASNPVDFLRLLAIGYDEVCWPDQFDKTPEEVLLERGDELSDRPHLRHNPLRQWVQSTFAVAVPRTASEIVPHPAGMDDEDSADPFWQWIHSLEAWR